MPKKRAYATEIVDKLTKAGYKAYFAGGWVRDVLMQHPSDDIDIATDAPPEVLVELFPKTIPVGAAFGVVIIVHRDHLFEVATFRTDVSYSGGRRPDAIVLSNPQEDALRRDFTINGMFYDPISDTIHDFVQGQEDLQKGVIRTIGVPYERFQEDRLRMIRAVRFAVRFDFSIEEGTRQAIQAHAGDLFPAVAMERIWQELSKMAKSPNFDRALLEMHQLGLLPTIFPALKGIELEVLKQRIAVFPAFPKNSPLILYLLELFPGLPLDQIWELCQYLKISGQESHLAEFTFKGKQLLLQESAAPESVDDLAWAQFYSHRLFATCFDVLMARYPEGEREVLLQSHTQRKERLLPHIQRLTERKPLVNAAILQDYGIQPGKNMGALLREAERLAVTYNLHHPIDVINLLKLSSLWPK